MTTQLLNLTSTDYKDATDLSVKKGFHWDKISFPLGIDQDPDGDYRDYDFVGEIYTNWIEKGGTKLAEFHFDTPSYNSTDKVTTIFPRILATETDKLPYPQKPRKSATDAIKEGINAYVFEIKMTKNGISHSVLKCYIEMSLSGVSNGL